MKIINSLKKVNFIVAAAFIAILMIVISMAFGYYYDLNDDVLIKDLLSGTYTGEPEAHNIQMLYPIGLLLAGIYKIMPSRDVLGLVLVGLSFASILIILIKGMSVFTDRLDRIIVFGVIAACVCGAFLSHLVFVQYTVVTALLSAAAAFLIMTYDGHKSSLILPVALITVGYWIRSEMMLLTLPLIGVAILISFKIRGGRFTGRKSQYQRSTLRTYVCLLAVIVACLVVSAVIDKIGYSSAQWQEFRNYFDNRTELYDFQSIPSYDDNVDFYDSIGITRAEQKLFENYNFGLDDEIDSVTVGQIADHAKEIQESSDKGLRFYLSRMPQALKDYIYRLTHFSMQESYQYPQTDSPWNLLLILAYVAAIIIAADLLDIGLLALLFLCRSTLWMYIIIRGRDPIRITHPMYFCELLILAGFIIMRACERTSRYSRSQSQAKQSQVKKRSENSQALRHRIVIVLGALIIFVGAICLPNQISIIRQEITAREQTNACYEQLYAYCRDHADQFYFIDVYTSVAYHDSPATYSQEMFEDVDNTLANYDLMGGWASKSPAYQDKIHQFGIENMQTGLLQEHVYMIIDSTEDTDWLIDYYQDQGIAISLNRVDQVADKFTIIKVQENH